MKITIVRHGETDSNIEHRYMGQKIDESLNETGVQQVEKLALHLSPDFNLILCSPLKRAFETAQIISKKLNIPVEIKRELIERDGGELSGMLWKDTVAKYNLSLSTFEKNLDFDFSPYGGESIEQVRQRVNKFFDDVEKNYKDKKLLVVTHGGTMKVMHALKPQNKEGYIPTTNAKLIEFEI
ncbi:MAG: histidine phosphatase family protein [Candidatus Doudnabacteria bacterium]|nr:histidine phosphatase family protein [Candidatus Doudnabacteria bacterium]